MINQIFEDFANAGGPDGLAKDLLEISKEVEDSFVEDGCDEPSIDVRVQYHDGLFCLYYGDSQYDQDHRGYWGSSSVGQGETIQSCNEIAQDIFDQILESCSIEQ